MTYQEFLETKRVKIVDSGFEISESELNKNLFDFQRFIVKKALKKGRYAIFADTGMGKTIMQLDWAFQVATKTNKPVLILAPLAVSGQTIKEGAKFEIEVNKLKLETVKNGIWITNYEQLKNIDCSVFGGIVLDESSILKNFTGKYKNLIIETFSGTPYKLACTATPSPNDFNEVGNHSEFLNILDAQDMRSRWFVRDEGMNNYRLKKHAETDFFSWISSWSVMIQNPANLGFDGSMFILPKLEYIEHQVETKQRENGTLFNDVAVNATNFNTELRNTIDERLDLVVNIVKKYPKKQIIIWIKRNDEGKLICEKLKAAGIDNFNEVSGSQDNELKEELLLGFAASDYRILVTKSKVAQFGMNFQNSSVQIFASLDFSFESLYQSVRRSYRFGQKEDVRIHIISTDTMQNVITSISRKESEFEKMRAGMNKVINNKTYGLKMDYTKREYKTDKVHLINGDSIDEIINFESDSIDLMIFSPPFSSLFTYTDNIRDMGNCADHNEFFEQYEYLLKELYRVLKPGRIMAVHTKDLAKYKNSSGYTGLYNFTGENHIITEKAGFKYHSKITIWTDPVLEMQRTKTQRLLYKQLRKDSTYSGVGLPEYVTIFRKWEGNEEDWVPVTNKTFENFPLDTWQKWASPVWMDIRRTDVLNGREGTAQGDEKHIAPLQLTVIDRIVKMWSNPGETVFTPFLGIGSEVYQAVKSGRNGAGIELKESYFDTAVKNINNITESLHQLTFDF